MKKFYIFLLTLPAIIIAGYWEWPEDNLCQAFFEENALKPSYFLDGTCDKIENSQTFLRIEYKVPAQHIETAHKHLQDTYGLGDLRFVCCGYETVRNGLSGHASYPLKNRQRFEHMIEKGGYLSSSIDMYVPADSEDDNTSEFPYPIGTLDGTVFITLAII